MFNRTREVTVTPLCHGKTMSEALWGLHFNRSPPETQQYENMLYEKDLKEMVKLDCRNAMSKRNKWGGDERARRQLLPSDICEEYVLCMCEWNMDKLTLWASRREKCEASPSYFTSIVPLPGRPNTSVFFLSIPSPLPSTLIPQVPQYLICITGFKGFQFILGFKLIPSNHIKM